MEPEDSSSHYSERLISLKGLSVCVAKPVIDDTTPDRKDFGLDPESPVYLCAQSLYKIHPEFDLLIAEILNKDKRAHVYFLSIRSQADDIFLSRLRRRVGPHKDRVHLLPRVPSKEFPLLLKAADVLLDVPHWSGGKTSLESFAAGTPIVHWPGQFMRGRHTLAFYKRMGVEDCIVAGAEEYVDTAIRLVHDETFRMSVRRKIAETSDSLFNDCTAIDEISDVFEALIRESR